MSGKVQKSQAKRTDSTAASAALMRMQAAVSLAGKYRGPMRNGKLVEDTTSVEVKDWTAKGEYGAHRAQAEQRARGRKEEKAVVTETVETRVARCPHCDKNFLVIKTGKDLLPILAPDKADTCPICGGKIKLK